MHAQSMQYKCCVCNLKVSKVVEDAPRVLCCVLCNLWWCQDKTKPDIAVTVPSAEPVLATLIWCHDRTIISTTNPGQWPAGGQNLIFALRWYFPGLCQVQLATSCAFKSCFVYHLGPGLIHCLPGGLCGDGKAEVWESKWAFGPPCWPAQGEAHTPW